MPHSQLIHRYVYCLLLIFLSNSGVLYAEPKPEIDIIGLNEVQESNVRAYLSLSKKKCDSPHWKIERLFEQAPTQIENALRALGYYHPQITPSLNWTEDCWISSFNIDAGTAVIISALEVQVLGAGAKEDFFSTLLQKNTLKIGDTLNHGSYEQLKKDLHSLADAKGYFDNIFTTHTLKVDPELNTANIQIHLQTGERYYIGQITIDENALLPEFNQKYLAIKTGDAYDRDLIVKSHQLLDSAGYFKNIQLKFQQEQAKNYHAPLTVTLTNLPRHIFSAGAGYDTDLGFRLSTSYRNRFVNKSGHQFISDLNLSLKKSNVVMEYIIPLNNPLKDRLSFFTGFTYEDTSTIDSQKLDLGIRLSNRFSGQLVLSEQLVFVTERFRNSNADPFETRFLLVPGISLSNTRAKKNKQFLEGYKYMLQLDAASEYLGSSTSFLQSKVHLKFAYSTFWQGRVIARADLGATVVTNFEKLPSSYRFYAGGDNSVRGYDYKSIGQRDKHDEVIGGRYLTTFSLEYEQKIFEEWSLAAFVDAGDAFSKSPELKIGAGLGVRWYSLIGPIRVDIAVPSDDVSDVHLHFSLSTAL